MRRRSVWKVGSESGLRSWRICGPSWRRAGKECLRSVRGKPVDIIVNVDHTRRNVSGQMPPRCSKSLFTPFSQADGSTTHRYGGTGMGLSIVKKLAQLMQDDAGTESEEGRGPRFWFTGRFPCGNTEQPKPLNFRPLRDRHVLVVDDLPVNLQILSEQLRRWGLQCDCVQLRKAGRSRLSEVPLTGRTQWLSWIINCRTWMANATRQGQAECLTVGMDAFLSKPFQARMLLEQCSVLQQDRRAKYGKCRRAYRLLGGVQICGVDPDLWNVCTQL